MVTVNIKRCQNVIEDINNIIIQLLVIFIQSFRNIFFRVP